MNTAAINILVHVFQCTYICTSIGCVHKKRVTDSLGMFNFCKYCQTYFQHGYSNFQSSSCLLSSPTLGTMCLLYTVALLVVRSVLTWWFECVFFNDYQAAPYFVCLLPIWISSCELSIQLFGEIFY